MSQLTLEQARQYLHPHIAGGVSVNDPRVVVRINEARERLFNLTDFKEKKARYSFCAYQNCITLPRDLETVIAARVDKAATHIRPVWFEYQDNGPGLSESDSLFQQNAMDRGDNWPCFRDICAATVLRVYADLPEDAGAKLTVLGIDDSTGLEVMTNVAGVWQMGEQIGINNAAPQNSTTTFRRVTGIRKPRTNGPVRLYSVVEGASTPGSNVTVLSGSVITLSTPTPWNGTPIGSVTVYGTYDKEGGSFGNMTLYSDSGRTTQIYTHTFSGSEDFDSVVISFTWASRTFAATFGNLLALGDGANNFVLTRTYVADVTVPDVLTLLGIFHPDDMVPSHRRYYIPGIETIQSSSSNGVPVSAICTRRYLPLRRDNDLVFPGNIAALKNMVLAIEFEARGNVQTAAMHEARAIAYLRKELKQHYGAGQVATLNIQMGGSLFHGMR